MSRQHQTRKPASSSTPKHKARFTAPPTVQAKTKRQKNTPSSEVQSQESGQVDPLSRLQASASVQAQLTIGQPNDKYEQEADRVAHDVVQRLHSPVTQTTAPNPILNLKPSLQRNSALSGGAASTELESSINRAKGGGRSLDAGLQKSMGNAMGADFSNVKVHTDGTSDRLNQSVQARAFTTGNNVFFKKGEYNPGSKGGQELIAHELTHVVQQGAAGVQKQDAIQRDVIQRDEDDDLGLGFSDVKNEEYNSPDLLGKLPTIKSNMDKFRKETSSQGVVNWDPNISNQQVQGGTGVQSGFAAAFKRAAIACTEIRSNLSGFTPHQVEFAYKNPPVLTSTHIELLKTNGPTVLKRQDMVKDEKGIPRVVDVELDPQNAENWKCMAWLQATPGDSTTEGQHPDAWHPSEAAITVWELSHLFHNQQLYDKTTFYIYNEKAKEYKALTTEQKNDWGIQLNDQDVLTDEQLGLNAKAEPTGKAPKGGKGKCCFITTACTQAKGLPDDCEELTVLRVFRDDYLATLEEGPMMIAEYYDIAPQILACIARREDEEEILLRFYNQIVESVNLVKAGQHQAAMQKYIAIVLKLKATYL